MGRHRHRRDRSRRAGRRFASVVAACLTFGSATAHAEVLVFAAASTAIAVEEAAALFAARGLGTARAAFAASSTLAKQIAAGAPADVYLAADPRWADYLEARGAIEPATRRVLVGNRLILVVPADSSLTVDIGPGIDLAGPLGAGRMAMGDPNHVPAGMYGKAALERLGAWPQVSRRIAAMPDVRAALTMVERGEAAAGIVYATDAAVSGRVRVAGVFPADSHPPIAYVVAVVAGRARPEVMAFMEFLGSPAATDLFARHGFAAVDRR